MASNYMVKVQIPEREHIDQETTDFFYGTPSFGFVPDENYSPVEFDFPKNLLGHLSHANDLLSQLGREIDSEFSDSSKRVHGRNYTYNGRMYRWDADEKELIRVPTYEEKKFAEEFFAVPVVKKGECRDYLRCGFKRVYSTDSRWSLCVYDGQCGHKDRLTSVYCGSFGRDWFCGPTTR